MKVSIKIVNKSHHALPSYSTLFSAGMDIRANLSEPVTLAPMECRLIPTGLCPKDTRLRYVRVAG